MDKLIMQKIELYGRHGVFAEETKLGQRFYIDLILYLDLRKAGLNDRLDETVNYGEVYATLKEIVQGKPYMLIEALAEHIASVMLDTYTKLIEITVRVHKPHPPFDIHFEGVIVEIHRERAWTNGQS